MKQADKRTQAAIVINKFNIYLGNIASLMDKFRDLSDHVVLLRKKVMR
jgi:hypothetical protein